MVHNIDVGLPTDLYYVVTTWREGASMIGGPFVDRAEAGRYVAPDARTPSVRMVLAVPATIVAMVLTE